MPRANGNIMTNGVIAVCGEHMQEPLFDLFAAEMAGIFRDHQLKRRTDIDIRTLTLDQAYEVQGKYLAARQADGERPVGYKVGCTSPAIQTQFGLYEPICGRLLQPHIYRDGERLNIENFVDCALEPELVFHIGSDLDGSNLETAHLRAAISSVSPGIEVHNYRFWYGRPTSQELIASNGIHAGLVIGDDHILPPHLDLSLERTTLVINGAEMASGVGAEIMDGPINSLRWLLTHLRKRGRQLRAGDLVIPGSAAKLIRVGRGEIAEAVFTHFGSCRAIFE
jgi:2-keto-4-pentenoate hydratase